MTTSAFYVIVQQVCTQATKYLERAHLVAQVLFMP